MEDSRITTGRVPRADAQRNRDLILDTAAQHFSEHGVRGSLDAIAKRAGIGAGTLYRHFPNREALLAALLSDRDDELVARRDALRAGSADTAEALDGWLRAIADWASAFEGLPEPLRAATATTSSPLTTTCQGFITTTAEFLDDAQRDGRARGEVRARDLFLAALATSWVRGAALADDTSGAALAALTRTGWEAPAAAPAPAGDEPR
ncbi:TetR/AcrR family transcriptional regulator [Rathayibacter tanaceti]|uniref:TetR family transcriptional regulator n=2 Tax=Rathayibacter tanaceti TaxID=1671680 RepID=A0ACD2XKN4_9MICO|nr:TetR/AcrR family transcriptional regulator [Rathayibacter tanaceti]KZX20727.1 putative HTH-type transcriptional regulator YxaF [Rathayibacter tanaceti]QHC54692.1 TetR family transcriptional regulator [Rathayibacter tanaceti]TCO37496.1 TetR family transcriptional regulator [Rathayibacter tanaceti]